MSPSFAAANKAFISPVPPTVAAAFCVLLVDGMAALTWAVYPKDTNISKAFPWFHSVMHARWQCLVGILTDVPCATGLVPTALAAGEQRVGFRSGRNLRLRVSRRAEHQAGSCRQVRPAGREVPGASVIFTGSPGLFHPLSRFPRISHTASVALISLG